MRITNEVVSLLALGGATAPMLVIKATVVVGLVWLAIATLRHATASTRHLVWMAGLVGLVLLPLAARLPVARLPILPRDTASLNPSVALPAAALPTEDHALTAIVHGGDGSSQRRLSEPSATGAGATLGAPTPASGAASQVSPSAVRASMLDRPESFVLWVWLIVATGIGGWLLAGTTAVRRIVRGGRAVTDPSWMTALHEIADRLDLADPPRLVISDDVELAFVCDLRHPTVVLPACADEWADDLRRAVLLHELAHVRRRDLAGHALGRVACALYWFHPMVWGAARQMRAESERACDDIVLACGARASDYAQQLLAMVTGARHDRAPSVALAMARRKEIEGRMLAILDPALPRLAVGRKRSLAVAGPFVLVILAVGATTPVRRTVIVAEARVPVADTARKAPTSITANVAPRRAAPATPATPVRPAARDTTPAQPRPVRDRTLGAPTAVGDEPFRDIASVRELSDGRLLVTQMGPPDAALANMMAQFGTPSGGRRGQGNPPDSQAAPKVILFDAKLKNATPVGKNGSDPTDYQNPSILIAGRRDTTLLIASYLGSSLLVIDAQGSVVGTRPLDGGVTAAAELALTGVGIDQAGRLIYQAPSTPVMQALPDGMRAASPDSVAIMAVDFKEKSTVKVAHVHVAASSMSYSGMPGQPGTVSHDKETPFPVLDDWVVMPDGTLAILRGADLHIDWISPNGKKRSTAALPYTRVPVTDADKTRYLADRHKMTADTTLQRITGRMIRDDPDSFPTFKPPFTDRGAKAASDGTIWLPSRILSPSAPQGYDVIDHDGHLVERVHLATGQKLVGFGRGVVYVALRDSTRVQHVARVPLR